MMATLARSRHDKLGGRCVGGPTVLRDRGRWQELQSRHVFCPRLWVAVSHFLDHRFCAEGQRLVEQGRTGLGQLAPFHQRRGFASVVVALVDRRGLFGFSFAFERFKWLLPEGTLLATVHTSLLMPLEERLLFCLPPRSQQRTSLGRDTRSVQAQVSWR